MSSSRWWKSMPPIVVFIYMVDAYVISYLLREISQVCMCVCICVVLVAISASPIFDDYMMMAMMMSKPLRLYGGIECSGDLCNDQTNQYRYSLYAFNICMHVCVFVYLWYLTVYWTSEIDHRLTTIAIKMLWCDLSRSALMTIMTIIQSHDMVYVELNVWTNWDGFEILKLHSSHSVADSVPYGSITKLDD